MSKRQREWAKKKRVELLTILGNKCKHCGTTEHLEFDLLIPLGHAHHHYDTSWAMSFYRQQHERGNVQILCKKCNAKKGDDLQLSSHTVDCPF